MTREARGPYIRLDIDVEGKEAIVTDVDGAGHTDTVYYYDLEGARHPKGPRELQEETARLMAKSLRFGLLRVNHSLIAEVIEEKRARAMFPALYEKGRVIRRRRLGFK